MSAGVPSELVRVMMLRAEPSPREVGPRWEFELAGRRVECESEGGGGRGKDGCQESEGAQATTHEPARGSSPVAVGVNVLGAE